MLGFFRGKGKRKENKKETLCSIFLREKRREI